jgi:anti-sigma-K factor RskA
MYDDDRDALAAEYVLGTLSADERDQAEALRAIDPGFAETVRVWERRLGELNVMVEAVEPPADVWDKIKAGIDGGEPQFESAPPASLEGAPQTVPEAAPEEAPEALSEPILEAPPDLLSEAPRDLDEPSPLQDLDLPATDSSDDRLVANLASALLPPEPAPQAEKRPPAKPAPPPPAAAPQFERSADIIYLARKARRWRSLTVAMSAIAAILALYIGVSQLAPGLIPLGRQTQQMVPAGRQAPGSRLVAVLQQEPTAPAFLLTVDTESRTLTVRRVTAGPDAGRSYELWLISNKAPSARSLGLVGGDEFTIRPIPAGVDVDAMRGASYAISLEPAAGSPSGTPTGPILFTGKMVESLPGAKPPG